MEHLSFYLSAASTYANQANSIFNTFLTVMFSSFGFAAALPLRDIRKPIQIYCFRASSSSLCIGFSLLAFYVISFMSFTDAAQNAEALVTAINLQGAEEGISKEALSTFTVSTVRIFDLGLPSVGFIIGASVGLPIFMWLTNVERSQSRL